MKIALMCLKTIQSIDSFIRGVVVGVPQVDVIKTIPTGDRALFSLKGRYNSVHCVSAWCGWCVVIEHSHSFP